MLAIACHVVPYWAAIPDSYNTSADFWEMLLGELGTDFEELEALGVNIEDVKEAAR